jgi:hypothetical protein
MHRVCLQTHSSPRLAQRVKRAGSFYEAAISNTGVVAGTHEVSGAGENQPFNFRSRISPASAGFALPLLSFITWPLRKFSAAALPD